MTDLMMTKIVSTIGPASNTEEKITELIKAGARTFRINSSHSTPDEHRKNINIIRDVAQRLGVHIPVLLDLQGPKIRIGNIKEPIQLEEGAEFIVKPGLTTDEPNVIPVDYDGIVNDVKKGERILLDDGKLALETVSSCKDYVVAKVVHGGELKARKGLNIPGSTASISAVTDRDIEYIKFGVEMNVDYFALSFVRQKNDILKAKSYIKEFGGNNTPIIAKIEKPQAIDNLEGIIDAADGVMVARGDLGIELSPEKLPIVQKQIIKLANEKRKPVITATQMLETMIEQAIPTRAEASDVANAILDGTDAVMLSGETAMGKFPIETVSMMNSIAKNTVESDVYPNNLYNQQAKSIYEKDSQAISAAVIRMLTEMDIQAIIAFTRSGFTAKLLSKAKPSVPIIAISDTEQVCRQNNLLWGVYPLLMDFDSNFSEDLLRKVDSILTKESFISAGDRVIITGGLPALDTGRTNFLRLHQIGSYGTMF